MIAEQKFHQGKIFWTTLGPRKGQNSNTVLGLLEQAGLLNKEPMGPLWRPWVMGPLEQAGAPDQEPVEPHGTSRGSRSKDNGPLELVALNQESMGLLRMP